MPIFFRKKMVFPDRFSWYNKDRTLKRRILMKTVYHNAKVYTGTLPLVEAFAVEDGRFVFADGGHI